MIASMGPREVQFRGADLDELTPSTNLLGDPDGLRRRLEEDGYLFLRGLLDSDAVLQAEAAILRELGERGWLANDNNVLDGIADPPTRSQSLTHDPVSHHPRLIDVLESPTLFGFFERFYGEPARTFELKWLRAVGFGQSTGVHVDNVFMGRGSERLLSCWVPVGDVPVDRGPLAVCVGSHRLDEFEPLRSGYAVTEPKDPPSSYYTDDPLSVIEEFGGRWVTADFAAGDILVFGMFTLHTSLRNRTDRYRISTDIRFQPASDPVDPRLETPWNLDRQDMG